MSYFVIAVTKCLASGLGKERFVLTTVQKDTTQHGGEGRSWRQLVRVHPYQEAENN